MPPAKTHQNLLPEKGSSAEDSMWLYLVILCVGLVCRAARNTVPQEKTFKKTPKRFSIEHMPQLKLVKIIQHEHLKLCHLPGRTQTSPNLPFWIGLISSDSSQPQRSFWSWWKSPILFRTTGWKRAVPVDSRPRSQFVLAFSLICNHFLLFCLIFSYYEDAGAKREDE